MIQCWLWGVLFAGITAAIWAPKLLQAKNIVLFILGTAIGQLCVYAMAIWPSKRRLLSNGVWFSFTAICFYIFPAGLMVGTVNGSIGVEVSIAIASILAAVSVATIVLAYRRWCRADLD
jgi:hypothetical protein